MACIVCFLVSGSSIFWPWHRDSLGVTPQQFGCKWYQTNTKENVLGDLMGIWWDNVGYMIYNQQYDMFVRLNKTYSPKKHAMRNMICRHSLCWKGDQEIGGFTDQWWELPAMLPVTKRLENPRYGFWVTTLAMTRKLLLTFLD
jgi:hypothetical protein